MEETSQELFSYEVGNDVVELTQIGQLEDTFEWCGHTFKIRTLTVQEEIILGLICREYTDTMSQIKAMNTAAIGAALMEVDGLPWFPPMQKIDSPNELRAYLTNKFHQAAKLYDPVLAVIQEYYANLLERQNRSVDELSKKFWRDRKNSSDSFDPLTDKEDSLET